MSLNSLKSRSDNTSWPVALLGGIIIAAAGYYVKHRPVRSIQPTPQERQEKVLSVEEMQRRIVEDEYKRRGLDR